MKPMPLSHLTLSAVAATALLWSAGCAGSSSMDSVNLEHTKLLKTYQRIYLVQPGGPESNKEVGYIGTEVATNNDGDRVYIHKVYGPAWSGPLGFYFDDGQTMMYDKNNNPKFIGNYSVNQSLEHILGMHGVFNRVDGLK